MDLARLRFGDWVMGLGGVAVLAVTFVDWYEAPPARSGTDNTAGATGLNAWESFAANDLILALAAVMAIAAAVITAAQPTAAVALALASLTTIVASITFAVVTFRVIWPPDVGTGGDIETVRLTGVWLGLVATTTLAAGCLASIRDERLPEPENPVEARLVKP